MAYKEVLTKSKAISKYSSRLYSSHLSLKNNDTLYCIFGKISIDILSYNLN